MKLKRARIQRTLQWLVLIISLAGIFSMLELGQELAQRYHDALSAQTQQLSRLAARQVAQSAVPDIIDNKHERLETLVQQLSSEPLILDASIYDLEGVALARTNNAMPLEQVTGISTPLAVASFGRQQIVEPIMRQDQLIGFIRITLEHSKLLADVTAQIENIVNLIRGMVFGAVIIGFALSYLFSRRKDMWFFPSWRIKRKQ